MRPSTSTTTNNDGFDQFWRAYPRKTGKLAARKVWGSLVMTPELLGVILAAVQWQAEGWTDWQFIPHPRTWLSQSRWLDVPPRRSMVVANLWLAIRLRLQATVPPLDFATWYAPLQMVMADDVTVMVYAPTREHRDEIVGARLAALQAAVETVLPCAQIQFMWG